MHCADQLARRAARGTQRLTATAPSGIAPSIEAAEWHIITASSPLRIHRPWPHPLHARSDERNIVTAQTSIIAALIAALLFGASTPFAKLLVGDVPPILLAGLLYLGSGLGLWLLRLARDRGLAAPRMPAREWPWFLGAIASGGVLAPMLLMYGLTRTSAANASLLLNLEAVFTALLAWIVFHENADRRVVLGMALIVAGGAILAWSPGAMVQGAARGAIAIAGAGLCWGLDNNLTRKVAASDAMFIAATKGLVAGITN